MINRDHDYTLRVAGTAIDRIKALSLPADPQGFELWYRYATGHDPELNGAINRALETTGRLSIREAEEIYHQYLASSRPETKINDAGSRLSIEVDKIVELLDELILSTSQGRDDCAEASVKLGQSSDSNAVRAIADALIKSLRAIEMRNAALEQRLSASKRELEAVQGALATMSIEASQDPLTALANRREFERAIEEMVEGAHRQQAPLSLLMIDIDHFKAFNDRFGHVMGDSVLRLVGAVLKQSIKGQDLAARYGGEEFTVILPNTTIANADIVAQQLCRQIASRELKRRSDGESLGSITVSIGVAAYRRGERSRTLIERADAALYAAKSAGRNCTRCEKPLNGNTSVGASFDTTFSSVSSPS